VPRTTQRPKTTVFFEATARTHEEHGHKRTTHAPPVPGVLPKLAELKRLGLVAGGLERQHGPFGPVVMGSAPAVPPPRIGGGPVPDIGVSARVLVGRRAEGSAPRLADVQEVQGSAKAHSVGVEVEHLAHLKGSKEKEGKGIPR